MNITQEEAVRYKEALKRIAESSHSTEYIHHVAKEALSPPEEMEEVEVKGYTLLDKVHPIGGRFTTRGDEPFDAAQYYCIPTTLEFSRPKKKKVLRREEIKMGNKGDWWILSMDSSIPMPHPTIKFYAEWEE